MNVLITGVGVQPVGVVIQQFDDGVGVGAGNLQTSYDGVTVGVGLTVGVAEGVGPTEY